MNFQTPYTSTGTRGFWLVIGSLALLVLVSAAVTRWRKWV